MAGHQLIEGRELQNHLVGAGAFEFELHLTELGGGGQGLGAGRNTGRSLGAGVHADQGRHVFGQLGVADGSAVRGEPLDLDQRDSDGDLDMGPTDNPLAVGLAQGVGLGRRGHEDRRQTKDRQDRREQALERRHYWKSLEIRI